MLDEYNDIYAIIKKAVFITKMASSAIVLMAVSSVFWGSVENGKSEELSAFERRENQKMDRINSYFSNINLLECETI